VAILLVWKKMGLQGCWATDGHGVGEVVVDAEDKVVAVVEKKNNNGRKIRENVDFLPIMHTNLLFINAQNPPLFIGGGKGTSYFYLEKILALNSGERDLNH